jgi:Calcineurin-like phosphoesterase
MAQWLADILGGHVDLHGNGDHSARPEPLAGVSPSAQAEAELATVRKRMQAWRDRWNQDAGKTLQSLRGFFRNPQLSAEDAKAWIDLWMFAVEHPAEFERAVTEDDGPEPLAFSASSWFRNLRSYLHKPPAINREERAVLDRLLALHGWPDVETLKRQHEIDLNPHVRQFENLDPWWLSVADAWLVNKLGRWPHLEKFVSHTDAMPFVYQATPEEATTPVALFADFGTGTYQSRLIARQLDVHAPAYAFHLGDVYYGGREQEFARYYTAPLQPVVQKTKLFSIAENHELYSGGRWYLDFLRDSQKSGITPQQGSYFCVRFPRHQIIAVDVNWHKRQRFLHENSRQWLAKRLEEAEGRTTILLTGSGPYTYGSDSAYTLLSDLWEFVRNGQIGLWIWGDDHYCAMFDRNELIAPFYGTCIGHGGHPTAKQVRDRPSWAKTLWLEDEPRFPAWMTADCRSPTSTGSAPSAARPCSPPPSPGSRCRP